MLCSFVRLYREGWDGLESGRLTPVLVLYTGSPNLNKGPKQRELPLPFEEFVPRPPNLPVKIGGDDEGGPITLACVFVRSKCVERLIR
ncbi:hypothetical protein GGI42DRAFT_345364 [Trichoderma sp. SZMC 28013]